MRVENYKKMVELQHEFNQQVDKQYLDRNWNWNSAIIAESGELLESAGYKWWRKTEIDMDNVKVEAIDLLHFVISESIQIYYRGHKDSIECTYSDFQEFFEEFDTYDNFDVDSIFDIINHLNYDQFDRFFIIKQLFKHLDMSNEDVYLAYMVKNCLNRFRQDNGYKDGSYHKIWNNQEDNVVAYELAANIGAVENLYELLYDDLKVTYSFYFKA